MPHRFTDRFPNTIAVLPAHSVQPFDLLGRHPQVKGVRIGHTRQSRARRHAESGSVPFVEVSCVKDYPGSLAHHRLFDHGSFRQEVRRISSTRALAHSTCRRDFFTGGYRRFAPGSLAERSFVAGGPGRVVGGAGCVASRAW